MGYTNETQITPALKIERQMLAGGASYSEVARSTGAKIGSVKERNRLVYGIDIRSAFRARVEREGIPNRYAAGDAFGHWFSGYFDGEGCLTVFERDRLNGSERRVGVQLACRYDDADVLHYIHKTLAVGLVWGSKAKAATNPAFNWRVEAAADLAQVILPLFDAYPMRTKKRLEYEIWRGLVINQYVNTLGGTSTRVGATEEEHAAFKRARQQIRDIRHAGRVSVA